MLSDGNKEEYERDEDVIILCSMNVERVVPGDEAERKFTQNSSHGTAHSTRFRRTKRGTERLVSLHSVLSHVPNGTYMNGSSYLHAIFKLGRASSFVLRSNSKSHSHSSSFSLSSSSATPPPGNHFATSFSSPPTFSSLPTFLMLSSPISFVDTGDILDIFSVWD
ncbi:hypothetical protein DVH24_002537 [Malus domestica]|uniref:Uncharacterized protein n=1 Tax=Malus domestica TaxID=3750 RepID=A0A498IQG9_MALDO|nr:hypothetical protein DVH24_002537 [Malus domestica]